MHRYMIQVVVGFGMTVLVHLGCTSSVAVGAEQQITRNALIELLSGYESLPSAEDVQRLGAGTPELLMDLAQDPTIGTFRQVRALACLRYYPDNPEVEHFLEEFLGKEEQRLIFLRASMTSLAHVSKKRAIPVISQYLDSEDVLMREAAAEALFATGDQAAAVRLSDAAAAEEEGFLRERMRRMSTDLTREQVGTKTQPQSMKKRDRAGTTE